MKGFFVMKFEVFKDPMSEEYIICIPDLDNACVGDKNLYKAFDKFVKEYIPTIEHLLNANRFDDCHIYCPNCGSEISPEVASTIIACPYCGCEWKR